MKNNFIISRGRRIKEPSSKKSSEFFIPSKRVTKEKKKITVDQAVLFDPLCLPSSLNLVLPGSLTDRTLSDQY